MYLSFLVVFFFFCFFAIVKSTTDQSSPDDLVLLLLIFSAVFFLLTLVVKVTKLTQPKTLASNLQCRTQSIRNVCFLSGGLMTSGVLDVGIPSLTAASSLELPQCILHKLWPFPNLPLVESDILRFITLPQLLYLFLRVAVSHVDKTKPYF